MSIEKCLKTIAMDPNCVNKCTSRYITDFGLNPCKAKCKARSKRTLTETERQIILYSMMYFDDENKNTHPDVREHLWLRASGAHQLMDSYNAQVKPVNGKPVDYYTALESSPTAPNPSVCTIKAD